jgi:hypothetical protein
MSREVMYAVAALIAIIAIVVLMSKTREGLENVPGKIEFDNVEMYYDKNNALRYFLMAPKDMQNDFTDFVLTPEYGTLRAFSLPDFTSENKASYLLYDILMYFYREDYTPAINPITENDIAAHLTTINVNERTPPVYKKHIQNGNFAKFLKTVFIDQVAPPKPKPVVTEAPPPVTIQTPTDFGQATELYKQNYVQYKTTGRAEYKTAYETAQSWIERYLQSMETQIANGRQSITSFVNKNAGAGTTLGQLGNKMKTIKKEGPAAQDAYLTIKAINKEIPEDNSDLYVKGGIAAALIGVAGIMSVF